MANQIIVSEDRNQITVVEGETRIVEVVTQGPQGPIGPVGPQGPSGSSILNQITSGSVTASVDIGPTIFSLTSGSSTYLNVSSLGNVAFSSSFLWDNANSRLGIGTSTPPVQLTVSKTSGNAEIDIISTDSSASQVLYFDNDAGRGLRIQSYGTTATGTLMGGALNRAKAGVIRTNDATYPIVLGGIVNQQVYIGGASAVTAFFNNVNNRVLIGTTTDLGERLQVSGSTRLSGDATITGSLTVTGNITAQTLVVQTITSSVSFITGSTKFGSLSTNTHEFTGSIFLTGSMGIGTNTPAALLDVYSSANANSSLQVGASQNVRVSINTQSANRFSLLTISRIGDGATPAVSIGVGTGPTSTSGVISTNNDSLIFGYNIGNAFTETFRINTSNRLLLGLTTDDGINRLQVSGSGRFTGGLVVTGSTTITSGLSVGSDTTINGIARINTASTYAIRLLTSTIIAGHDGGGGSELSLNLSTAYLSGYGALQLRTLQSGNLTLATSNTNRVWVSGVSGNVSVGSSNDSGDRLQVYGATFLSGSVTGSDMLIRGSGNTSALEVQNNSAGTIAQFRNDTRLTLGGKVDIGLTNILFNNYSNTLNILGIVPAASWASDGTGIWFFDRTASSTSGTLRQIRLGGIGSGFTPTSGTATHTHLEINSTISQSSATGITRGLYVNPTLTSAANWRSIEWSNNESGSTSWGLYGAGSAPNFLSGSLGIGTAPSESLSISQLRAVVSIKDSTISTNSTTFFGAYDDFLQLSANRNPSTGIFSNTGKATSQISLQGSTNSGSIYFYTTNTNNTIPVERVRITGTGNLLLGTTTDDTVNRLQVSGSSRFIGNMVISGSGNTSATTALTIQNSSNTNLFRVLNDGKINFSNTGMPANTSIFVNISNGYVNYGSSYSNAPFFTYQAYGSWESIGADSSTGTILAVGGYRASQWSGVTLHANGNEVMRVKQNGQVRFVPLASAPAGAEAGDVYYNSTDNKHYGYNGTTWNAFY